MVQMINRMEYMEAIRLQVLKEKSDSSSQIVSNLNEVLCFFLTNLTKLAMLLIIIFLLKLTLGRFFRDPVRIYDLWN